MFADGGVESFPSRSPGGRGGAARGKGGIRVSIQSKKESKSQITFRDHKLDFHGREASLAARC